MSTVIERQGAAPAERDAGLRDYMLRVYRYLGYGLVVSTASAYAVHKVATTTVHAEGAKAFGKGLWLTPLGETLYGWPGAIGLFLVAVVLILAMRSAVDRAGFGTSMALYLVFTAAFGISLAAMVGPRSPALVMRALSVTALAFGALSLYGYTTKRDLSGWGSFLFMGLVGLVGVGLLNALVFHSSAMQTAASFAGVLVFCGYLAYDTQKIRDAYHGRMSSAEAGAVAVWGAMDLYLDLLNLFFDLLRILGDVDWGDAIGGAIGSAFDD